MRIFIGEHKSNQSIRQDNENRIRLAKSVIEEKGRGPIVKEVVRYEFDGGPKVEVIDLVEESGQTVCQVSAAFRHGMIFSWE